jgi:nitrogen fixation/metabolism regulation signal transduction histidine kinase
VGFERSIIARAVLVALPALVFAGALAWRTEVDDGLLWGGALAVVILTLAAVASLRRYVVFPLYTITNLLEALREGDYSLRGTRGRRQDAMGDVVWEVNALADLLAGERRRAEETMALMAKIVSAIDIGLFTFDEDWRLRMVNPAGQQLLGGGERSHLGRGADELGLAWLLRSRSRGIRRCEFPGGAGRYDVRRYRFRQAGLPHYLLVITDLSRTLRDEERQTWQRLIRVLGHELNNSLAPIKSLAGSLVELSHSDEFDGEGREDLEEGLELIGARAEALSRFLEPYTRLARLPPPQPRPVSLRPLLEKIAALEPRVAVRIGHVHECVVALDPDQIEQALINLVKNAADASSAGGGEGVDMTAAVRNGWLTIEISDDGPGIGESQNLFVPFFSTKPGGSGVGLVLARSIVEGHGGDLVLANRQGTSGCIARMLLPVPDAKGLPMRHDARVRGITDESVNWQGD